jgi:hypothetical protein
MHRDFLIALYISADWTTGTENNRCHCVYKCSSHAGLVPFCAVSTADRSERNHKKTKWRFGNFICVPGRGNHSIRPGTSNYSQTLYNIRTTDSNVKDTSNYFTPQAKCYVNFTGIKLIFIDYLKLSNCSTAVNIKRRSYRPWKAWKPEEDNKLIAHTVSLSLNSECQVTSAPPCLWTRKFGKCFYTPSLEEEKNTPVSVPPPEGIPTLT